MEVKHWVTGIHDELPIQVASDGKDTIAPQTVMDVFTKMSKKYPERVALSVKRDGQWKKWHFKQYYEETLKAAAAFVKLGLQSGQAVAIMGFNSPEWFISDLAAIAAGGIACGVYTTNGPEATHYVIEHSEAAIVVVETEQQCEKILKLLPRLPLVKKIIQWSGKMTENEHVMSWEQLMKLSEGDTESVAEVERRITGLKPNKTCTLIYTSGTTGPPKAVMITHDNITWTAACQMEETGGREDAPFAVVSYLPLSHIAAQMVDIHAPLSVAGEVWFAAPDALKGSLVNTLKEVRPTHFLGVPRIWEKIEEKMRSAGAQAQGMKKSLATWAKKKGLEGTIANQEGKGYPTGWWLANTLVFNKVKVALGLDRCIFAVTGAAPIAKTTLDYFNSLNLPLHEVYGMSESTGAISINTLEHTRTGTVGRAIKGIEVKLDNPDAEGHGEIIFRGRNQFSGYLKNDKDTSEAIDANGFIHTGDVGKFDKDGFLSITGRIKELIITAGGENIPPVLIEDELKKQLSILSNAMLIGDKRKFLSCLITLKMETNKEAKEGAYQFSDNLAPQVIKEIEAAGSQAKTIQDALKDDKLREFIQAGVDRYNKVATSAAQRIQKFTLLEKDFTLETGELTPTLKLKRKIVSKQYEAVIDKFYEEKDKD